MAISSIHVESGGNGFFAHNSRESKTVNSIFSDEENFCSCTAKEAFEIFRNELLVRGEAYKMRTGQNLQKNTITHLSAIVNFNKEHTPEDIAKVCKHLEDTFDTKVIQYAMHRDEGHVIDDETKELHDSINVDSSVKNYHAHIEFMGIDSQGYSIRRKIDKPTLKRLQTEVAEILGMERGRKSGYSKEQFKEIKSRLKNPAEYGSKETYKQAFTAVAKELGFYNPVKKKKRLDTYDYKEHAEKIAELQREHLATINDLKTEVAKVRAELQEAKATRPEYAMLEKRNKELQERLRSDQLSKVELDNELVSLRSSLFKKEEKLDELKFESLRQETKIDELQNDVISQREMILEQKTTISTQKVNLNDLKQNLSVLEPKANELDELYDITQKFRTETTIIAFMKTLWNKLLNLNKTVKEQASKIEHLESENKGLKERLLNSVEQIKAPTVQQLKDTMNELDISISEEEHKERMARFARQHPELDDILKQQEEEEPEQSTSLYRQR